jgi:hypothetical protein
MSDVPVFSYFPIWSEAIHDLVEVLSSLKHSTYHPTVNMKINSGDWGGVMVALNVVSIP